MVIHMMRWNLNIIYILDDISEIRRLSQIKFIIFTKKLYRSRLPSSFRLILFLCEYANEENQNL